MKTCVSLMMLVTITALSFCQSQNHQHRKTKAKVATDSLLRAEKAQADSLAEIKIDSLKQDFNFDEDKFNHIGWYINKHLLPYYLEQNVGVEASNAFLQVHVRTDGYYYLESQYSASDWLYHTRIRVLIGDSVTTSDEIPGYDSRNERDVVGSRVFEEISFTGGGGDGVIKAIASCGDKQVTVRFDGSNQYYDRVLSRTEVQAIRESFQLSQLLEQVYVAGR